MRELPVSVPVSSAPDVLEALSRSRLFGSLPVPFLHDVADQSTLRLYRRAETLWRRGDPCDRMAVVRRGRVSSSVEGEGGRRCVVEIVRAGGECGLTSVVDGGEHAFTDAALDRSVVALVPAEPVREAMARDPQFALRVARALSSDAHHAQALCADLTCRSPMERLARYLGERTSGREVFELRDTQRQIAAQLGTVREVVARSFHRLEVDGILQREGRVVRVLRAPDLARIAWGRDGAGSSRA